MSDSISRIEHRGDRLTVISPKKMSYADYRSPNVLTNEYSDLYTELDGGDTVRVGTVAHPDDVDGFQIHGANGIYFETAIIERELTDEEISWCEDTIRYSGSSQPETVFEFEIPHPEMLRSAILKEDIDAFDDLTARNPDHAVRHDILTDLQDRIEQERLRKTKLDAGKGYPIDLEPEWDPENDHNDRRDTRDLHDMAGMRSDSHMADFHTIAGFRYYIFFYARARHLGLHEPNLEYWDIIALDVLDKSDWSHCRLCGGVLPENEFLHVQRRGAEDDSTFRVCDDCAERDGTNKFTAEHVSSAKDDRARKTGGQRRLNGEYTEG